MTEHTFLAPHAPETLIYHTLVVTFRDDRVRLTLVCHAPERARCRLACSKGCEQWSGNDHEHPLVSGDCLAVDWMDAEVEEYCKASGDFPVHHGMPVSIEWVGDTYVWSPILLPG